MPLNQEQLIKLKAIRDELYTADFEGYEPLDAPFEAILKQNKRRITPKDQTILKQGTDDPNADRSTLLFALGGRLIERGVPFDHAFVLLRESPINKFQGRSDEVQRLYEGLVKVRDKKKVVELKPVDTGPFQWLEDDEFRSRSFPQPSWLVEGVWVDASKGFIAAEPKCGKSTFAFDLALSVATGTPFLGHFEVKKRGRVLIIQEEMDAGDVQWRRREIMRAKGFDGQFKATAKGNVIELDFGQHADVGWLHESQFKLDDDEHREMLEAKVRKERPTMVIFDPLQRMLGHTNIRNETEMNEVFDWLDHVRRAYRTSVVVVHHLKKPSEELGYDDQMRLLGSQALASWYESMLMLTRTENKIRVRPTFRSKHNQPFSVQIDWGDEGEPFYECEVQGLGAMTAEKGLKLLVKAQPGITYAQAAKILRVSERRVRDKAKKLGLKGKKNSDGFVQMYP